MGRGVVCDGYLCVWMAGRMVDVCGMGVDRFGDGHGDGHLYKPLTWCRRRWSRPPRGPPLMASSRERHEAPRYVDTTVPVVVHWGLGFGVGVWVGGLDGDVSVD